MKAAERTVKASVVFIGPNGERATSTNYQLRCLNCGDTRGGHMTNPSPYGTHTFCVTHYALIKAKAWEALTEPIYVYDLFFDFEPLLERLGQL